MMPTRRRRSGPPACRAFARWLEDGGHLGAAPSEHIHPHARQCRACASLLERCGTATQAFAATVGEETPFGAETAFMAAARAARAERREHAIPRWAWGIAAVMSVVFAGVLTLERASDDATAPAPPSPPTEELAATPTHTAHGVHPWLEAPSPSPPPPAATPLPPSTRRTAAEASIAVRPEAEAAVEVEVEAARAPDALGRQWHSGDRAIAPAAEGDTLVHPEAGTVTLATGAEVDVEVWTTSAVRLGVDRGAIYAQVQPRAPGQRFEIATPYATVRVLGTAFEVQHEPGIRTRVRVVEGIVEVLTPDLEPLGHVLPGETLDVEAPRALRVDDGVRAELIPPRLPAAEETPQPKRALAFAALSPRPTAPVAPGEALRAPRPRPSTAPPPPADVLVDQARDALARGDDALALRLLDALSPHARAQADALAVRGDALRLLGRRDEAAQAYLEAARERFGAQRAHLHAQRAELWEAAPRDAAKARGAWQDVLATGPATRDAARAHLALAEAAAHDGDWATARSHYEVILVQAPRRPEAVTALAALGRHALQAQDWSEAQSLFTPHIEGSPPALAEAALVGLLRVRIGQRDRQSAEELLERYQARFPHGSRRREVEHLTQALSP